MTSGTLCRRDSPQSRSSLHSSSSGGSTSLTSGATDGYEDTPSTSLNGCSGTEEAPVNVPQMFSQGVPVSFFSRLFDRLINIKILVFIVSFQFFSNKNWTYI